MNVDAGDGDDGGGTSTRGGYSSNSSEPSQPLTQPHSSLPALQPSTPPRAAPHAVAAMPTPMALNSTELHSARLRFGKNDVTTSVLHLQDFLRYPIVSPTMCLIIAGLVFNLTVYIDCGVVMMLLFVLLVGAVVVVRAARGTRGGVSALHRCFQHSSAIAYREGTWAILGATQLVPGDLIQLVQGSHVHADCTLYRGSLLLNMVQLTGRTEFTTANPGHLLKAGTVVVDGAGSAVVRYTGWDSFVGQTVRLVGHLSPHLTRPRVERVYVWIGFVLLVVLVTAEVLLHGLLRGWYRWPERVVTGEMMLYAVVCLPLLVDVAVLQSVRRGAAQAMEGAQAVVLRLGSLLSLASADVLVVDKSGTLTTGVYSVADAFRSFSPHYPSHTSLVQLMALATKWREPCVHALRRAVLRSADLDECDHHTRLAYVEHEGEHRTSTVLRRPDGKLLRVTEGDVSAVLTLLAGPMPTSRGGGDVSAELVRVYAEAQRLASTWGLLGLRTRAVAAAVETGPWELAGLVTFTDTVRHDAAAMVRRCRREGITVTIASGDAKSVVTAAAAAVFPASVMAQSSVMTGDDLPRLDAWQVLSASSLASTTTATTPLLASEGNAVDATGYAACRVYAEMQPEHKVALVRLLQQSGRCVAYVGDGLNDAAAAYVADCGVALVTPDNGGSYPMRGALWGADVALPSLHLTDVSVLVRVSRELFATVYALLLHAFTVALQASVLVLLAPMLSPSRGTYLVYGGWSRAPSVRPSGLFTPLYASVTVITLLVQARKPGDALHWGSAPCHANCRVAAAQAAGVAFVGVCAGVPLAMSLPPFSFLWGGVGDSRRASLLALSLVLYLLYTQLFLTVVCASPVRCGLHFVRSRVLYVATCALVVGVVLFVTAGCYVQISAAMLAYSAVVAVLQDMTKLAVHRVCYRMDVFHYRSSVDRMQRLRRQQRSRHSSGGDSDDAEVATDGGEGEREEGEGGGADYAETPTTAATSHVRRPLSAALNAVLGCLVPLDLRLVTAVEEAHTEATDEE